MRFARTVVSVAFAAFLIFPHLLLRADEVDPALVLVVDALRLLPHRSRARGASPPRDATRASGGQCCRRRRRLSESSSREAPSLGRSAPTRKIGARRASAKRISARVEDWATVVGVLVALGPRHCTRRASSSAPSSAPPPLRFVKWPPSARPPRSRSPAAPRPRPRGRVVQARGGAPTMTRRALVASVPALLACSAAAPARAVAPPRTTRTRWRSSRSRSPSSRAAT